MRNLLFCRHRACPGDLDAKSASDREGRVKPGHDKTVMRPSIWAREQKFLPEPPATVADGVFEGYASLFGIADLGKDVVAPGAFAETLARRGPPGVRMLRQHDPAEPIGRWLSLAEDARGLQVRGKLNLAVARARELHALMKDGGVDGLSIGFRVERARADKRAGLRRLERIDLREIALVTFPMLPGARVSGVKQSRLNASPRGAGRGRPPDCDPGAGEGAHPGALHPETPPHPRSTALRSPCAPAQGPLPAGLAALAALRGEETGACGERRIAHAIRRAAARLFNV